MPRAKVIDTCSGCGEKKPLFDVKNKLCGSCAGKKGGGRPKSIKVKETPQAPLEDSDSQAATRKNVGPAAAPGNANGSEKYLCESCGKEVRYGQRKCRCGVWCDWRGTAVEADPDIVICPECGAVCGFADDGPAKCPHCNQGG